MVSPTGAPCAVLPDVRRTRRTFHQVSPERAHRTPTHPPTDR